MENSSPNPSFSICDIQIQKQISRSFGKSFPPDKLFRPADCPNTWRAEPRKKNALSFFRRNHSRANPKSKELFSFWGCRVKRGSGGTIRAYDSVSHHHARGACDIICFENRCELGTIKTPVSKLQFNNQ